LTADRSGLTTTNFVLRAVDTASNTTSRAFNIIETPSGTESFTSSGTFAVPSGVSNLIELLVVAGGGSGGQRGGGCGTGGGGAGGLVYIPNATVTPGGTIAVTIGDGGAAGGANGQDTTFGGPGNPGLHPSVGVITAKGGGGGGGPSGPHQNDGGSGNGGAGGNTPNPGRPTGEGWPLYAAQHGIMLVVVVEHKVMIDQVFLYLLLLLLVQVHKVEEQMVVEQVQQLLLKQIKVVDQVVQEPLMLQVQVEKVLSF
jgi:hypothetical protein